MPSDRELTDSLLPESVRQTLTAMSQAELLQLLLDVAEERDDFRRALMGRLTIAPQMIAQQQRSSAQVRALKQQIDLFFDEMGWREQYRVDDDDEFGDEDYYEDDPEMLSPELAETFALAKLLHPLDRMEVYWYVLTRADAMETDVPLVVQISEALLAYAQAARGVIHTPEELDTELKTLLDVLDLSFGDEEEVKAAVLQALSSLCETPEAMRQLIALLRQADEARFADWIAAFYRLLGDDEAYLAVRIAHLRRNSSTSIWRIIGRSKVTRQRHRRHWSTTRHG